MGKKKSTAPRQERSETAVVRTKIVDELLLGDMIVEYDHRKPKFFRVTDITTAACSPYKTHVKVDALFTWCYDSALPIQVRQNG
jgi:hypothetical protein